MPARPHWPAIDNPDALDCILRGRVAGEVTNASHLCRGDDDKAQFVQIVLQTILSATPFATRWVGLRPLRRRDRRAAAVHGLAP